MQRILSWLALIIAVAVSVVAVLELDNRAEDDVVAEATTIPSPRSIATPRPSSEATESPDEQESAAAPAPSRKATPGRDTTKRPATAAPEPPRTPTPEPAIVAGPIDTTKGRTPRTGGNVVPAGIVLAAIALVARAGVVSGRRHTGSTTSSGS